MFISILKHINTDALFQFNLTKTFLRNKKQANLMKNQFSHGLKSQQVFKLL